MGYSARQMVLTLHKCQGHKMPKIKQYKQPNCSRLNNIRLLKKPNSMCDIQLNPKIGKEVSHKYLAAPALGY